MKTNTPRHNYNPRVGDTWCRKCNCSRVEHSSLDFLDPFELDDYVSTHGVGKPNKAGYTLARELWAEGDSYATIAHELVFRGLHR